MSSILRRERAPLADSAWAAIDEEAIRILRGNLSARAVVNVDGPHGWEYSAVNLGRVDMKQPKGQDGVNWGLRQVMPLVEYRAPLVLSQWEMDNITRGATDPNLEPLTRAAQQAAVFEETLIYHGLKAAGVAGILGASPHAPVKLPPAGAPMIQALEAAVFSLQKSAIGGPYALVLDSDAYTRLAAGESNGYPLRPRVRDLLEDGKILWSPAMKNGGALISTRGGDYELVLGQDLAIGFAYSAGDDLHLYLTETLTLRINEPAGALALQLTA